MHNGDGCATEGKVVAVGVADGSADAVQVAVPLAEGAEVSIMASFASLQ